MMSIITFVHIVIREPYINIKIKLEKLILNVFI